MKIGICAAPRQLTDVDVTGVDFCEANVQTLLCPQADETAFAAQLEALKACPLPTPAANCFLPGSLKTTGPEVDDAALDRYVQTALRRAQRAGVRTIVFGSGGSRQVPEGFSRSRALEQIVGFLRRVGPWAADHDVTIVVEPLQQAECNIVNTVDEGRELINAVDMPGVALLADLYHMLREEEGPEAILRAGPLLAHTHVAEKAARTPPGVAGDDFRPFLAALRHVGYGRAMSLECKWDDLKTQLAPAVAELRRQMDEVGLGEGL